MGNSAFSGCLDFVNMSFLKFLGNNSEELEFADLAVLNLSVARGIPALAKLDIAHYVRKVDEWTKQFATWLRERRTGFIVLRGSGKMTSASFA